MRVVGKRLVSYRYRLEHCSSCWGDGGKSVRLAGPVAEALYEQRGIARVLVAIDGRFDDRLAQLALVVGHVGRRAAAQRDLEPILVEAHADAQLGALVVARAIRLDAARGGL